MNLNLNFKRILQRKWNIQIQIEVENWKNNQKEDRKSKFYKKMKFDQIKRMEKSNSIEIRNLQIDFYKENRELKLHCNLKFVIKIMMKMEK